MGEKIEGYRSLLLCAKEMTEGRHRRISDVEMVLFPDEGGRPDLEKLKILQDTLRREHEQQRDYIALLKEEENEIGRLLGVLANAMTILRELEKAVPG